MEGLGFLLKLTGVCSMMTFGMEYKGPLLSHIPVDPHQTQDYNGFQCTMEAAPKCLAIFPEHTTLSLALHKPLHKSYGSRVP